MKINLFNVDSWYLLSSENDNDFTVRHEPFDLEGASTDFACIFVSSDKSYNLLISPTLTENDKLINITLNGLKLSYLRNWMVYGRPRQTYIHLKCEQERYVESFTKLIKEIISLILFERVLPTIAVNTVIRTWKSFWGNPLKKLMSENEIIGLMAELKVIQYLMSRDPETALNSWKGPFGHKYDFVINNHCLEVKATQRNRHVHVINGLDQLDSSVGRELYVVSLLAEKSNEGKSINTYIDEIMSNLHLFPDLIDQFMRVLSETGYSPEHSEEYQKILIFFRDSRVFPITDQTPKITTSSFKEPLSQKVTDIRYTLEMDGLVSVETNDEFFDLIIGEKSSGEF